MKWISVKDSLPEVGRDVLIYEDGIYIARLLFYPSGRYESMPSDPEFYSWSIKTDGCGCCGDKGDFKKVTHWMELPEFKDDK